jgi:hypothetical protein
MLEKWSKDKQKTAEMTRKNLTFLDFMLLYTTFVR